MSDGSDSALEANIKSVAFPLHKMGRRAGLVKVVVVAAKVGTVHKSSEEVFVMCCNAFCSCLSR